MRKTKRLIGFASVGLLLISGQTQAGSDLMIHPTRIVIDKNQRSAKIDLTNTGSELAAYRITLENKRMTPTGEFVPAKAPLPGELFADQIVQFSPRQIELAPGSGQTVRILVKRTADLMPGEYRSQLVFSRLPSTTPNNVEGTDQLSGQEIGIYLKALIGVSIPVIVIQGDPTATGTLSDIKVLPVVQKDPPQVQIKINRSGNRSLYGDLSVKYVTKGDSEQVIAEAKGLAVYNPNPFRVVKLPIRLAEGQSLSKGRLEVSYTETRDAGGKPIANATLDLP